MSGVREGWRTRIGRRSALASVALAMLAMLALAAPHAIAAEGEPVAPASEVAAAAETDASAPEIGAGESPAEGFAAFLSQPVVAALLLSIGIWALIFAFKIPGTGVPEIVAVLAFGAFLFGKHAAGLAGWEDAVLVGVGAALLALEIFVVPGLGVAGILGVLAMGAGLVMAAVGHGPSSPQFWPEVTRAVTVLGVALGLGIAWSVMAYLALRKTEMWKRFTLRGALEPGDGESEAHNRALASLAGSAGVATTALRPEGDVEIGGKTYPARAERGYLDTKTPVAVVSHDGTRLVVRAAEAQDSGSGDSQEPDPEA